MVLVRVLAYGFPHLRTGDVAWVTGDKVDQAVADGFLAYVAASDSDIVIPPEEAPLAPSKPEPAGDVYDRMSHDDLYGLAQVHQIAGRSKMSDTELVAAVRRADNGG